MQTERRYLLVHVFLHEMKVGAVDMTSYCIKNKNQHRLGIQ